MFAAALYIESSSPFMISEAAFASFPASKPEKKPFELT
jgi:hypothetical protein